MPGHCEQRRHRAPEPPGLLLENIKKENPRFRIFKQQNPRDITVLQPSRQLRAPPQGPFPLYRCTFPGPPTHTCPRGTGSESRKKMNDLVLADGARSFSPVLGSKVWAGGNLWHHVSALSWKNAITQGLTGQAAPSQHQHKPKHQALGMPWTKSHSSDFLGEMQHTENLHKRLGLGLETHHSQNPIWRPSSTAQGMGMALPTSPWRWQGSHHL